MTARAFHPLFTLTADESEPGAIERAALEIGFINVTREVGGKYIHVGKAFEADELPSLEAFTNMFGGGKYELWGRDANNRYVINRVRFQIEGQPRSFETAPQAQALPGQPVPQPGVVSSSMQQMIEVITLLKALQPAPTPPPPDNTGLMFQAISTMMQSQSNLIASIMGQNTQAQGAWIQALASSRSGDPAGGVNAFMQGLQTMQGLVTKLQGVNPSEPDGAETAARIVEAIATAAGNFKEAINSIAQASEAAPPTGATVPAPALDSPAAAA